MRVKLVASTKDKTTTGEVSWTDEATPSDLGSKPTVAYVEALENFKSPKLGLLPPAVRWISFDKRLFVFERPPCYQTIEYIPRQRSDIIPGDNRVISFVIPIPWTVYIVGLGYDFQPVTLRMYGRPEPLNSKYEYLFLLPIMNFYTNGRLCNPIFSKYEEHDKTIAAGVQLAYNSVWNSGFNFDLIDAVKNGVNSHAPFKPHSLDKLRSPLAALDSSNITTFFSTWSRYSIEDFLAAARWMNPSIHDAGEPGDPVTLEMGINAVQSDLKTNMGSTNIAKNFITTLVNNFSLT